MHASLFTRVNEGPLAAFLVLSSEICSAQTTLSIQDNIKMFTLHKNKHIDDVNASTSFALEHLCLNTAEECMAFPSQFSFQHVVRAFCVC